MKLYFILLKIFRGLKKRKKDHKTDVYLFFSHIQVQESILKQKLTENLSDLFQKHLKDFYGSNWETKALAILHSELKLVVQFEFAGWDRYNYLFFPGKLRAEKRIQIQALLSELLENKIPRPTKKVSLKVKASKILKKPKSLHLSHLRYLQLQSPLNSDYIKFYNTNQILDFNGKVDCFFRIYRLQKIEYKFKTKTFFEPFPIVAELFIRAKDRYSDVSFGKSKYVFMGHSLQTPSDNFLLNFWGLQGIADKELIALIPKEIFSYPSKSTHNLIQKEYLNLNYLSEIETDLANQLMKSDGQVSIS